MSLKNKIKRYMDKNLAGWLFLAPFMILLTVFIIIPVLTAFGLSFTSYNMLQKPVFVGLENFRRLILDDEVFLIALKNTFIFALFIGPIGYFASFFMAWILDSLRFRNAFSVAFYAPSIASAIAMTVVWGYFFSNDRFGFVNNLLIKFGFIESPILWNQEPKAIFFVIIFISIWMSMGTGFLVFLAGLQNLPQDLFEQGRIDGIKNRFQELFYIIIPMMKPQLLFGAIMSIVGSFAVFDVSVQFAGMPSPNYAGHTIVTHLYDYAFIRFEMGYASAVAVMLFLITFLIGRFFMKVLRTDDY